MSRIPQTARAKTPTPTPLKARAAPSPVPARARTKSATGRSTPSKSAVKDDSPPAVPTLSVKEAIALKRAEAKKAQERALNASLNDLSSLEDAIPSISGAVVEEEDALGRWSVRETIERGRSSGVVNLTARSLPCIPSALFEIHLGITPDPLKSVPNEPNLPPSDTVPARRGGKRDNPAWFEAHDLTTLKVWSNDIAEIQHEISMFGSLKVLDLHKNQITSLPKTFGDLTRLTTLDLSHNSLTSLPSNIFTFPELSVLNISHNHFTSLPCNAPFVSSSGKKQNNSSGGFFGPVIARSSVPLPKLVSLDASHNKITAEAIDPEIPTALVKINLSFNPLGNSAAFMNNLSRLSNLQELRMEQADIGDESFPEDINSSSKPSFPRLRILDLGETRVTTDTIKAAVQNFQPQREISLDLTTENPPEGVILVLVGKKVVREAWEIEAERKAKARAAKFAQEEGIEWGNSPRRPVNKSSGSSSGVVEKEAWEIEAEQGLLTEGGKRRAKAQAVAAAAGNSGSTLASTAKRPVSKAEIVKEAWEIEAEQGLLTEGGRRRARAAALAAEAKEKEKAALSTSSPAPSLANSQYYTRATNALALPASTPPSKAISHGRAFSFNPSSSAFTGSPSPNDFAVPLPSAPLAEIAAQPFALTLRVLTLNNRRADRSFTLPASYGSALLPNLEELDLEGCNFADNVSVARIHSSPEGSSPNRSSEPLVPLLASLFPSLRVLNLSYNILTSACLTTDTLSALILEAPHRKGLKQLILRGNKLTELDGFQGLAEMFKGNRDVPGWKLDELDLRDNDIGRLPAELGMLPLDVFLVDGNAFRVPPRRIWEREGTKGLLSWLRGRME
ncbi:L domain-like protein [Lentinula edodes]|nr:L domain-like protein [Lentinula edodes]